MGPLIHAWPAWFLEAIFLLAALGALLAVFNLLLRRQVRRRVRELSERNSALEAEIRKRGEAEDRLREREALFRAAFNMHPDAVNINRLSDGLFIDVNQGFVDVTGYAREDVIGKTSLEIDLWHDPADRKRVVEALLAQGYVNSVEAPFRMKDGRVVAGLMSASAIKWEGETHIFSITRNIEGRKQTEEKYRALFESSPEGIAITDMDGHFLEVNRAFEDMVGYDAEALKSKSYRDITPAEYGPEEDERIQRLASGLRMDAPYEKAFIRRDGERIPVALRGWIIRDSRSRPIAMGAFIKDIRRQKEMEREKAELEARLRHNQKMEAIGTLSGGIAHDFNNILNAILGYAELLKDTVPADQILALRFIGHIHGAGLRARDLVRQILEFSRESGGAARPVNVGMMAREALKLIRATLPKTIVTRAAFSDDNALVMADPTQIHQVVMNLCANASQAMGEDGGTLAVGVEIAEFPANRQLSHGLLAAGRYLHLAVRDTGAGIAPEHLPKIFDPYFTTKTKSEGTGLGLSVTLGIVRSHGGAIHVESLPGEGATFSVFLPLAADTGRDGPAEAMEETPLTGGTERLLFVDDEALFADIVQRMLSALGYAVTAFQSSIKAMECFSTSPGSFDLIITDQTMPRMSGLTLIEAVRAIRREIPIILCTGFSENVTREAVDRLGISRVLMKPVSKGDLARAIREALD